MNCSIMPLIVLFHNMFLLEKHSSHVAFPPSFSALMADWSSSMISCTSGSSSGTLFSSDTTAWASASLPVPKRCRLSRPFSVKGAKKSELWWTTYGDSGKKRIPENRIIPQRIWRPIGMRQEADPLILCVPSSITSLMKILGGKNVSEHRCQTNRPKSPTLQICSPGKGQ